MVDASAPYFRQEPIIRLTEPECPMESLLAIQELPTFVLSRSNAASATLRSSLFGSLAMLFAVVGSPSSRRKTPVDLISSFPSMFETRNAAAEAQQEFWIETRRLPQATASTFYRKLDATLDSIGFAEGVREICLPAYADIARGGRPGIDPVVYFKMLIIGFFENLPSERAIASRCADSLSLRAFLGYGIEEATPDNDRGTYL
jgi:hypothetical protein